jgi:phosphoserine aminotransferase
MLASVEKASRSKMNVVFRVFRRRRLRRKEVHRSGRLVGTPGHGSAGGVRVFVCNPVTPSKPSL